MTQNTDTQATREMSGERVFKRLTDTDMRMLQGIGYTHGSTIYWDEVVRGLHARASKSRVTWVYLAQWRHGANRGTSYRRLGFWPSMSVKTARKLALVEAGRGAGGRPPLPGLRKALKVSEAFEQYVAYRRAHGKPGSDWPKKAESIYRNHIGPAFGSWALRELAENPEAVASWHKGIQTPITANRAAKVISALYRRAARTDRSLPPYNPSSAVVYNRENRRVVDMPWQDWAFAWEEIPDPVQRSFAMVGLLTGMRPGEAQRVTVRGDDLVVTNAKAGADLRVPTTPEIEAALQLAGIAGPGSEEWRLARRRLERSGLPVHGHGLRHVYASVAVELGIDPLIRKLLLGHTVSDVTMGYALGPMLQPTIRQSQERISKEIVRRLSVSL
jgi:integrase